MNIKIQCACGTKFSFDVIPVNGRMPMNVNCPGCNVSALDLANAELQRLCADDSAPVVSAPDIAIPIVAAPATPSAPSIPSLPPQPSIPSLPKLPTPSAPTPVASAPRTYNPNPSAPQPPQQSSLKIKSTAAHAPAPAPVAAGEAAAEAAGATPCPRHKTELAVEHCFVCQKPICPKCMEQFGYVCSVYCDQQAVSKKLRVPVYAQQKRVRQGQSNVKAKRLTFASIAVVLLLLGLWFWYAWFARDPKVVYTVATPHPDLGTIKDTKPAGFYQLIGPGVLLSVKEKQLALYDVAAKKELWTARLQSEAEEQAIQAAKAKNEKIMKLTPKVKDGDGFDITQYHGLDPLGYEDDYSFSNPRITATTNDIWVSFRDRLMQFDRVTGNLKDPGIKGKIRSLTYTDDSILAVSSEPTGREVLTEIALPQGTAQTEEISPATNTKPALAKAPKPGATAAAKPKTDKSTNATANPISVSKLKAVTTQTAEQPAPDAGDDFDAMDFFQDRTPQFVAAGPNVVQFSTKLLEKKIIAHQAMKSKGKSIMDDNLTAGQSMDAAQEMLNDMQRSATGGVENEDVSRYQVTVHRRLAGGLPDWSGEVNGPPNFVALKTVDIVTAGNSITVLDKNNKKLWDAKLTYSVQAGGSYWDGRSPYLETKDSLYVADKGVLTRFDLATGNVRWRLNSVGISRIQTDTAGNLYLDTTSAGPETIKFSQEVNIHNKTEPVTMKVSATTGKVLWRLLAIGDGCIISGKFVYTTRISQQVAFLHLEDGPDTHYNLNLLKPSTGSRIWNYHLGNQPVMKTEIQKNWILIQTRDQVLVLKFFSL